MPDVVHAPNLMPGDELTDGRIVTAQVSYDGRAGIWLETDGHGRHVSPEAVFFVTNYHG